jgi:hypothetical protein
MVLADAPDALAASAMFMVVFHLVCMPVYIGKNAVLLINGVVYMGIQQGPTVKEKFRCQSSTDGTLG